MEKLCNSLVFFFSSTYKNFLLLENAFLLEMIKCWFNETESYFHRIWGIFTSP